MVRNWRLLLILTVAGLLRIWPWLRPHALNAVWEYDDGVYYAASRAVLHGLWPYRDFTIVHPPLISLLLLPFALLGAVFGDAAGMAAARVATVAVGVANIWLVYLLALRHYGAAARGLALWLSGQNPVYVPRNAKPSWFEPIMTIEPQPEWLIFAPGIWAVVGLSIVVALALRYSLAGRSRARRRRPGGDARRSSGTSDDRRTVRRRGRRRNHRRRADGRRDRAADQGRR